MSGVAFSALPWRLKYLATTSASAHPRVYYGLRSIAGKFDSLCVTKSTELVVEGFPRSANSRTVHGLLDRQKRPLKIAHHKHHVAQLLRAVQWEIPAVLLIREPQAAVVSNLALMEEARARPGRTGAARPLGLVEVLWAYVVFYRNALTIVNNLVIAPFEEVTEDISPLIERINRSFDMGLVATPREQQVERELGWHAMPNPLRTGIKADISTDFNRALARSGAMRQLENTAQTLRENILDLHARAS